VTLTLTLQFVVGHEESLFLAAKNCSTECEIFAAVRETLESVLCLFGQERIYLYPSLNFQAQRNQMFCDKTVLIFMIHVVTFLWVAVGIVAVKRNIY
jgi:hypothetical protein